jgi:CelD/BcsL family acetyltransferase involved in cellulose biosynthesis
VNRQLHSEIHRDTRAFLSLQREWNPLLLRSPANTIFLAWEWQKAWWDCFGQSWELCLLELRDGDDLVGLAPLYTLEAPSGLRSLQFVGGVEVSDYLDLIVARDSEESVYETFWGILADERAVEWDVLDLHNVPATSPTLERLTALVGAGGSFEVTNSVEEVCPVIHLPATWEEYISSLNKKQRHEVRRKLRKASREAEVQWYYAEDSTSLEAEVDDFISLHRKSAAAKEDFMDERMRDFFQRVARDTFQRGWLRLAFLVFDGVKAASMLCFEYDGKFLVYNSGYDPELYPSLSSGIVLLSYCIRDAIDRGLGVFDFLRGEEEYKYRFGGVRTEVRSLRIVRQRSGSV